MSKFSVGDKVVFKAAGPGASQKTVLVPTADPLGIILTADHRGYYTLNWENDLELAKKSLHELIEEYLKHVDSTRPQQTRSLAEIRKEMREAIEDGRD